MGLSLSSRFPRRYPASPTLRPEKILDTPSWLDGFLRTGYSRAGWPLRRPLMGVGYTAKKIIKRSEQLQRLDEEAFTRHRIAVRQNLSSRGLTPASVIEAFAMVRESAGRSLGMRHHHTQIRASLVMLYGMVAEMATGEGKTLACTLASCTAALAGVKVHVVTTNDYLAERDCEEMTPLFEYLNLAAGSLNNDLELEDRQQIYAADILYCSNNELVFDYLKDSLVLGERKDSIDVYRDRLVAGHDFTQKLMHQGLVFAIVDEADSVFIDESRTPLIISGGELPMADSEELLRDVMAIAQSYREGEEFEIDWLYRRPILKKQGRDRIEEIAQDEDKHWNWHQRARAEELLMQALSALYLFQCDKHYIVGDDKIMIVDEYTGRLAEDRSWEGGLHQMIEIKEGCELTQPQKTLAKISYQQFFRKYFFLSGMTGTAHEVRHEFFSVYNLLVYKIPLLKKTLRKRIRYRVLKTLEAKEAAIIEAVIEHAAKQRSVLVGTATVAQSERLSQQLTSAGVAFELLTAKQDSGEADIVSQAGQPGRVTIATSMAGRGTDIKLAKETRDAGGLHVIICELQDASRIDRQLEGRCARQGDPGTVEYIVSYDDPLINIYGKRIYQSLMPVFYLPVIGDWMGQRLQRYCQWRLENKHARERKATQKSDQRDRSRLAFLGGGKWS
ncbi:MAG: hypothetical protein ACRBBW_08550 [Cellvibrionaceae bacterium]